MTKTEELYDLKYDPTEQCNIVSKIKMDVDRHINYPLDQVYFYPRWDVAEKELSILRTEFNRIWDNGTAKQNLVGRLKAIKGLIRLRLKKIIRK